MKNSDIVKICSEPLKTVAKKYDKNDIDPSFMSNTLGYILSIYKDHIISDDDITIKNNPIGIIDPTTAKIKNFSNLEDCFLQYKDSYYDDMFTGKVDEEITKIAKAFNLYRFDKEIFNSKPGNIVDLTEEESKPVVDVYKVEKRNNVIGVTSNLEEAEKMKEKNSGSVIKNSRGVIVGEKSKTKSSKILSTKYDSGTKIICDHMNLYKKFRDTSPSRTISGEYYMYDGKIVNGRIAICAKPEFVGDVKMIVGFVRVEDFAK